MSFYHCNYKQRHSSHQHNIVQPVIIITWTSAAGGLGEVDQTSEGLGEKSSLRVEGWGSLVTGWPLWSTILVSAASQIIKRDGNL